MKKIIMLALLSAAPCFHSDVVEYCCVSACAVKHSPKWNKADEVLRSCMARIGCHEIDIRHATVFSICRCN